MSCPGWHASPGGDFISVQGKLSIINRIQLAVYYQCCVLIVWATTKLYVTAYIPAAKSAGFENQNKGGWVNSPWEDYAWLWPGESYKCRESVWLCDFRMVLTGMWSRGWTVVWPKYSVPAINIVSSVFSLTDCTLEKQLSTQENWI